MFVNNILQVDPKSYAELLGVNEMADDEEIRNQYKKVRKRKDIFRIRKKEKIFSSKKKKNSKKKCSFPTYFLSN